VFLSTDGLYRFDGNNAVKISLDPDSEADRLQDFFGGANPARRQYASAVTWEDKGVYMIALARGSDLYNYDVAVWDYDRNVFWIWRLYNPAQSFASYQNPNGFQEVYFGDEYGQIFQMEPKLDHDHGAAIDWFVETAAIGYKGDATYDLREVSVTARNLSGDVDVTVRRDDERVGTTAQLAYGDFHEKSWGVPWGFDWTTARARTRVAGFRKQGEFFNVKVGQTNTRGNLAKIASLNLGFQALGRR
jgi:hypothetical protein